MAELDRKKIELDVMRTSPGQLEIKGGGALRLNTIVPDSELEPILKTLASNQMNKGDTPIELNINFKAGKDQLVGQSNMLMEIDKYGTPSFSGNPDGRFISDADFSLSGVAKIEQTVDVISIKPSLPVSELHNFDSNKASPITIGRKSNDHSQLSVDNENATIIQKLMSGNERIASSGSNVFELTNSRSKVNSLSPQETNSISPNVAFEDMRLAPLGDLKKAADRLALAMMKAGIPESLTPNPNLPGFDFEKWKPILESNALTPINILDASKLSDSFLNGVSVNYREKMVNALANDMSGAHGPQASLRETLWKADEDAAALVLESAAVAMGAQYGPELKEQAQKWAKELGNNQELKPEMFERINQYVIENQPKPDAPSPKNQMNYKP